MVQNDVEISKDHQEVATSFKMPRGKKITGRVVSQETGDGIEGISVAFHSADPTSKIANPQWIGTSGTTDEKGQFNLSAPEGKGYVALTGSVRGYDLPRFVEAAEKIDKRFYREVNVETDKATENLLFSLDPVKPGDGPAYQFTTDAKPPFFDRFEGIVIDEENNPVEGAEVGFDRWFRQFQDNDDLRIIKTGADGRFTLRYFRIEEGNNLKAMQHDRHLLGQLIFTPEIARGTADHPLELHVEPTGKIVGYVRVNGNPITRANVQLSAAIDQKGSSTPKSRTVDVVQTDQEGRFEFPFVPADREILVYIFFNDFDLTESTFGGNQYHGKIKAGETRELKPFDFIRNDKSVAGIVVDREGKPLAGVSVSASNRDAGSIAGAFTHEPTGPDGRWVIGKVPDTTLSIMAYIRPDDNDPDQKIRNSSVVEAMAGDREVRIILDPKLLRKPRELK